MINQKAVKNLLAEINDKILSINDEIKELKDEGIYGGNCFGDGYDIGYRDALQWVKDTIMGKENDDTEGKTNER